MAVRLTGSPERAGVALGVTNLAAVVPSTGVAIIGGGLGAGRVRKAAEAPDIR
jgi:hypothetical protein